MTDLTVSYMGIKLKNPVIAGACGITANLNTIQKAEAAGAGAIVCKSLFEEEIQLEALHLDKNLHKYDDLYGEMLTVYPQMEHPGPEDHLHWVKKAKDTVQIPVFASLNAVHEEVWLEYAKRLADTGVDGIELNLYTSPTLHYESADTVEREQLALLEKIRMSVKVPLAVKLSPIYTNVINFISRLEQTGINGFILFNRFFQSDIDIRQELSTFPFTFSRKEDNRLSLRYTGLLYGNTAGSLCCNTGIMDYEDVVKMLLAGADAVQVVSTLYKNGINYIAVILNDLKNWMEEKQYTSIADFKGNMSREKLGQTDRWIYKRTQYVKMLMQSSAGLAAQIF